LHCEATRRVGLHNPPDLFVKNDSEKNAFAGGAVDCFICLNTGLLNALTNEELLFILGHEMGHIIHRHVLHNQIASQMAENAFSSADRADLVADGLSLLGGAVGFFGSLVAGASAAARVQQGEELIEKVLCWDQFAELSADRVGLITCRSADDAVNALVKIDLEPEFGFESRFGETFSLLAFLDQYDQAARDYSFVAGDKDYKRSHPYTAYRIRALQAGQLSSGYFRLVTSMKPPG